MTLEDAKALEAVPHFVDDFGGIHCPCGCVHKNGDRCPSCGRDVLREVSASTQCEWLARYMALDAKLPSGVWFDEPLTDGPRRKWGADPFDGDCPHEAKPKRGRPPKATEDLQDQRVTVRLTRKQVERLDELRGEMSRSAWLARTLRR